MDISVIKYNGDREPLDISKIHKVTKPACEGLPNVSQSELESSASIYFQDGIKTEDIQKTLIKTAVDKIDIDRPAWTHVAARLHHYDMLARIKRYFGSKPDFPTYIKEAQRLGIMALGYTDVYDFEKLQDAIAYERTDMFTYLGIVTLEDRYLLKSEGETIEDPQHMFMAVCMFLCQNDIDPTDKAIRLYNIISMFYAMFSTPTLSNGRKPRSQLASCYIGSSHDSAEGIQEGNRAMAILSKFGGGIGWDFTPVRGPGADVDTAAGASNGTLPYLKTAESVGRSHDQLGVRKGSIAPYLETWHNDLRAFIELKRNSGEERLRTHDLFPALWVNDLFMERVKEDSLWTMFNSKDYAYLSELDSEDFKIEYIKLENDPSVEKESYSAKAIWKDILKSYFETGAPFLSFKDTAARANPNAHTGVIRSSNLCVSGDTRVLVKDGYTPIKDLAGKTKEAWNGQEWSDTEFFQTGEDEELMLVTFSNGIKLKCTDYHKHPVGIDDKGEVIFKETRELGIGDTLIDVENIFDTRGGHKADEAVNYIDATYGITMHDMFKYTEREIDSNIILRLNGEFWKDKKPSDILEWLSLRGFTFEYNSDNKYVMCTRCMKVAVKSIETCEEREPTFCGTEPKRHTLMFNGVISGNCTEIFQNTDPGTLATTVYFEDDTSIVFDEDAVIKTDAGLVKAPNKLAPTDYIAGKRVTCIESHIVDNDIAVCNLASVNMSRVKREQLKDVMPVIVRALDNVIDLNFYPVKAAMDTNKKTRAIGVGVMGEAEAIALAGIEWGSEEHMLFVDQYMEEFSFHVIKASCDLAKEKGAYPLFKGSNWEKGIFPFDVAKSNPMNRPVLPDWDDLKAEVKEHGVRNGYMMAIAPTSTISILTGTTQTIEPIYKRKWFEENLSGLIPVIAPSLSPDTWNLYKPAFEIDQLKIVKLAAIRQRWIDQGQSVNIFASLETTTGKVLNDIYMGAWESGVKSTYYLRSESPEAKQEQEAVDRSQECLGCQ